ncbi:hypothetical protein ES703_13743 [subsurface metagenome]
MEEKKWNPLADIASVLGSIAQKLPPLPKPPELPRSPSSSVPEPRASARKERAARGRYVDLRDPLMVNQMEYEQKRQAEQGLVVFTYE